MKAACTVWGGGKPGDNIKGLPITVCDGSGDFSYTARLSVDISTPGILAFYVQKENVKMDSSCCYLIIYEKEPEDMTDNEKVDARISMLLSSIKNEEEKKQIIRTALEEMVEEGLIQPGFKELEDHYEFRYHDGIMGGILLKRFNPGQNS